MNNRTTVFVKDAEFFVGMGYYEDEKKLKNKFVISLEVSYHSQQFKLGDIETTVNYKVLMDIISLRIHDNVTLLEDVAEKVLEDVIQQYSYVFEAEMEIVKTSILVRNIDNKGVGIKMKRIYG